LYVNCTQYINLDTIYSIILNILNKAYYLVSIDIVEVYVMFMIVVGNCEKTLFKSLLEYQNLCYSSDFQGFFILIYFSRLTPLLFNLIELKVIWYFLPLNLTFLHAKKNY
jgi:hypothetical protein